MNTHGTTDDTRIAKISPIIQPALLIDQLPLDSNDEKMILEQRQAVTDIITGKNARLLVVTGPCSIHDEKSALEYASRLKTLQEELKDELELVMRVYFEKPRTTVGWKGFINDPRLDDSCDINEGLHRARALLIQIMRMGLGTGTEYLDVITPQYIADVVIWGAIGARTTESQIHRQLASGLSMPIGFKNGTDGGVDIAIDAIQAAAGQHSFLSVTKDGVAAIVRTRGNLGHVILRGGRDKTNYDIGTITDTQQKLRGRKMHDQVMVDFSHNNTLNAEGKKDHKRQLDVGESIGKLIESGSTAVHSVMIESHLNEGKYAHTPGKNNPTDIPYGTSITDGCIGWRDTEELLRRLANAVKLRRSK